MPYVITIEMDSDVVFYAGPTNPPAALVELAHRYPHEPVEDVEILRARGFTVDWEVVP